MNLENQNADLDEIIMEAQTMRNYHHANVLPLYTSFVHDNELWMVMPFITGGSVLHIMKYSFPEGLEEVAIATIIRDVLRALEYVHKQGGIHRDIKAGNILVDKDGCVKLADFGVATSLERNGSWGHDKAARMTFVGTPCWMAPEVMEQTAGYDNAADIWSVGITLLEMAHGHAPFAKFPPMKVLLMTLQNPPPTLDDKGKKHFSKFMKDVVTRCLQKDPHLRPTAAQLLEHRFFKQAKDNDYLARHLMSGLPSLGDRVQEMRSGQGRAATTSKENEMNFVKSQEEYKKGVSSWNFDVSALKAQAELEELDNEPMLPTISEADEEGLVTLSGMAAIDAANEFVAALASPTETSSLPVPLSAPDHECISAFASQNGQKSVVETGVIVNLEALGDGSLPPSVLPSPSGALSPMGVSREGSFGSEAIKGVPSVTAINAATPQAVKQKGRFSVYEGGESAPPMSPAAAGVPAAFSTCPDPPSTSQETCNLRESDDGSKKTYAAVVGDSAVSTEDEASEPKKKVHGRFTVTELNPLGRNSSTTSLSQSGTPSGELGKFARTTSEAGMTVSKPPAGPSNLSNASSSIPPVTVILPKLKELLDHASQQQLALQRIMSAVLDCERSGKASPLLSRTKPASAFDPGAMLAFSDQAGVEDLRASVDILRTRLADVEAENAKLKQRNRDLEAAFVSGLSGMNSVSSLGAAPSFSAFSYPSAPYPTPTGQPSQPLGNEQQMMEAQPTLSTISITASEQKLSD